MLEEVHVCDLALIREVWLRLGPGLNVLSGETGAGKTVLVEALQLLVGERGDSMLVRSGADETLVEGRFVLDGEERLARRRLTREGRSYCYLDGVMATVGGLAEALGPLVDLHGQHDHQALLRSSAHAGLLDRYVGEPAITGRDYYRRAHAALVGARAEREAIEEALTDREGERDYLAFQVDEIDSVGPQTGEDDRLEREIPRLRHGEKLASAASTAFRALRDEGRGTDAMGEALSALRGVSGIDGGLDDLTQEMEQALMITDDLASRLRTYGEMVDYDPATLDMTEARLAALGTLKKKYGPTLTDVAVAHDRAVARLEMLDTGDERLEVAREVERSAEENLRAAASRLSAITKEALPGFIEALSVAAEDLAMGAAVFDVVVEDLSFEAWTSETPVHVEFLFSSSAGDQPRPLAKVASGGEVSRVMLALKGVLGVADATPVLVFDEIDAGIGGQTAVAVGRRLAGLAQDHQVIVITHLAQVAAFADRHLVVARLDEGDRSVTTVAAVEGEERVRELARMLAGGDSDTGLAHARELLESVGIGA